MDEMGDMSAIRTRGLIQVWRGHRDIYVAVWFWLVDWGAEEIGPERKRIKSRKSVRESVAE